MLLPENHTVLPALLVGSSAQICRLGLAVESRAAIGGDTQATTAACDGGSEELGMAAILLRRDVVVS